MAKYTGPQCRLCRAESTKLFLKGERCHTSKCPIAKKRPAPGKEAKDRKGRVSDYGNQLREKQKLKRMYGMLEKQFKLFFDRAEKKAGKSGDNLIIMLESRLDNVVYRMRFASSRQQARQLVNHGHILVNGKRVNIPSFIVKEGDVIAVREKSKKMIAIKESLKELSKSGAYAWLSVDPDAMTGKFVETPKRSEITDLGDVHEHLIVELYSR
ncbi:MAG: 30S ribosomal protein S4 [Spirochaetales bacterium]|nr:30S ribosomal protein S4 [Spirochaetales bacterium]